MTAKVMSPRTRASRGPNGWESRTDGHSPDGRNEILAARSGTAVAVYVRECFNLGMDFPGFFDCLTATAALRSRKDRD